MYCNNCGNELQANQAICPRCSTPVRGAYVLRNRVETHLTVLGILWIAYGVLHIFSAFGLYVARYVAFEGSWTPPGAPFFVGVLLHVIVIFLVVTGVVGLAAGVGLMRAELWARPLIIALGIISLINAPFGTALGIYTLWALLGSSSSADYERLSAQRS